MTALLLAAASTTAGTGGGVPAERASAGSLALLVIALLGVATVLLIRNMNKRLKRMPREFPAEQESTGEQPEDTPGDDRV